MWEDNCVITLTYDDEKLPYPGTLVKKHFTQFMKALRYKIKPKRIRYFHCGEYGEDLGRPHYHAVLFNHQFDDLELFERKIQEIYTHQKPLKIYGEKDS